MLFHDTWRYVIGHYFLLVFRVFRGESPQDLSFFIPETSIADREFLSGTQGFCWIVGNPNFGGNCKSSSNTAASSFQGSKNAETRVSEKKGPVDDSYTQMSNFFVPLWPFNCRQKSGCLWWKGSGYALSYGDTYGWICYMNLKYGFIFVSFVSPCALCAGYIPYRR